MGENIIFLRKKKKDTENCYPSIMIRKLLSQHYDQYVDRDFENIISFSK